MKIMTILGTRPEIIRLSRVIPLLDQYAEHILVHTGQNYDQRLSDIFFNDLDVRTPDLYFGVRAESFAGQIAQIMEKSEEAFKKHHPDRLVILGDTNSGTSAIIARRMGIPVYHMEAGNRCYDDRVPEEINRRVIDHSSSILMPYTQRSRENLLAEGFANNRIYVTGNPIKEVLDHYQPKIDQSNILDELNLKKGQFFLVTMHRAENVDRKDRLTGLLDGLSKLHQEYNYPVICSFHPRTRSKAESFGLDINREGFHFLPPFGFFDFIKLTKSAFTIISDSGTVQEEACILGIPNVTIRDVTERPETIECGSNLLCGAEADFILRMVKLAQNRKGKWQAPDEYLVENVADTVSRIVLGYAIPDRAAEFWNSIRFS